MSLESALAQIDALPVIWGGPAWVGHSGHGARRRKAVRVHRYGVIIAGPGAARVRAEAKISKGGTLSWLVKVSFTRDWDDGTVEAPGDTAAAALEWALSYRAKRLGLEMAP